LHEQELELKKREAVIVEKESRAHVTQLLNENIEVSRQ